MKLVVRLCSLVLCAGLLGGAGCGGGSPDRVGAAQATAQNNPLCTAIAPFYWEIGDANGPIASGSLGTTWTADTPMNIASASKLVFGAYVVQKYKDDIGAINHDAMTMRSGYVSLSYASCLLTNSVDACFMAGSNSTHTPGEDGVFHYDGGHFQYYADTPALGLGPDGNVALATEMEDMLGHDLHFGYSSPQLAGGMRMTPGEYAVFLRKILSGGLAIHDHLGENAVCTLPSACPNEADYSPAAPEDWHYSYGHWVEDDPTNGDGTFSSPGAFGFYPWIDASKHYYGIVARYALGMTVYIDSVYCGVMIRKAFMTGKEQ